MIRDEYINILDIVLCLLLFLHSDITKHLASTNLECLQHQTIDNRSLKTILIPAAELVQGWMQMMLVFLVFSVVLAGGC